MTAVNGNEEIKVEQEDVDDPINFISVLFEKIEISGDMPSASSTTAKSFANHSTTSSIKYFGGARPKEQRQNRTVAETQQIQLPPTICAGSQISDNADNDGHGKLYLIAVV
jgi:hypothetical protein